MSVVQRDNPELRGKPVVVTPSANVNGTSEVSFCIPSAEFPGSHCFL